MFGVLSEMHLSFVHLTKIVRCRAMGITVKDKKKEGKPDHFSTLMNSKGRMRYTWLSNGGVTSKH